MRQISTKHPNPHSPPRPTQCDRYRQNIRSHSLPLVRHNATNTDINTKATLSPSSDTIRQIPTKTPKPRSPSSDKMRQISTKTPKPRSPLDRHNATVIDKNAIAALSPRPTQYDKYRQTFQSRTLPLDRHNATVIDKTSEATHSTSTDTMRQISTKRQSRTLPLVRHNTTVIDKTPKPRSHP